MKRKNQAASVLFLSYVMEQGDEDVGSYHNQHGNIPLLDHLPVLFL